MLGVIEESLAEYQAHVGINVGKNVGTHDQVLALIRDDPSVSAARIAELLGVSSRQVERAIKAWRDAGVLTRTGSRKTGRWAVSGSEASDHLDT